MIERDRGPLRDLVLDPEQIVHITVEPLHPKMRVGLGVDQLGADAEMIG